jgi:hypothetical protein
MKFDAKYKPELCTSADETRPHLCNVHFDAEKKCLVATDGHRMVMVPCVPEEHDVTGWITEDALKLARKDAKKRRDETAQLGANGALVTSGCSMERPAASTEWGQAFPPYQKVIPTYDPKGKGITQIGLNVELLYGIMKALGAAHGNVVLTIRGKLDPILVTTSEAEAIGVLMPVRV